jgi:hypothetical protein
VIPTNWEINRLLALGVCQRLMNLLLSLKKDATVQQELSDSDGVTPDHGKTHTLSLAEIVLDFPPHSLVLPDREC